MALPLVPTLPTPALGGAGIFTLPAPVVKKTRTAGKLKN